MSERKLIAIGAEARIYEEGEKIIKDRVSKGYRIKEIDEKLRKSRNKSEAKILRTFLSNEINVPRVLKEGKFELVIQKINGEKLRDCLSKKLSGKEVEEISFGLEDMVGQMHNLDIYHGDLTTSNVIRESVSGKLFLIDFGLSGFSHGVEEKAVDLHLFRECLTSRHINIKDLVWQRFLDGYKKNCRDFDLILKRFSEVELRGRYKRGS